MGILQTSGRMSALQENVRQKLLKTYVYHVHGKYVQYDPKALYCLKGGSAFRRCLVWLIEWKWFDRFTILLIFLNSGFLATYDYSDRNNLTYRNQIVEDSGWFFTIAFTIECALKIMGMGFIFHKKAYLRDGWNWIDFIVVIIGVIEVIPGMPNLKALRTFRVLRPLRSINAIPSMRRLISSLIASLPSLANVVIFLVFIFIMFGILGVQQFVGSFYWRCRETPEPILNEAGLLIWNIVPEIGRTCSASGDGAYVCPEGTYCGHPSQFNIPLEQDGVYDEEGINYAITTFDNLGYALLTIFQVITLEGWTSIMYNLMDSNSIAMASIYFCLLVLFGSFFLLNLILAVIMESFDRVDKKIQDDQKKSNNDMKYLFNMQKKFQEQEKDPNSKLHQSMQIESQKQDISMKPGPPSMLASYGFLAAIQSQMKKEEKEEAERQDQESIRPADMGPIDEGIEQAGAGDLVKDKEKEEIKQEDKTLQNEVEKQNSEPQKEEQLETEGNLLAVKVEDDDKESALGNESFVRRDQEEDNGLTRAQPAQSPAPGVDHSDAEQKSVKLSKTIESSSMKEDIPMRAQDNACYRVFYKISMHQLFFGMIIVLILANTIVLAMDRYPISETEFKNLEITNQILSWMFFLEMIIKMIGLGIKDYAKDKFNLFDCTIVIISTVELIIEYSIPSDDDVQSSGGGAVSAFRAIRLLRVFKLARSWKSFQEMLVKIGKSLKDISNFSVLLFLFLFTYSLLGMELFAHRIKFDEDDMVDIMNGVSPRENFDGLAHAFTTIFIVLTGEDWNAVMYSHIRASGMIASIFFISLVIFGNFILLNLFLAILLKNFEEEEPKVEEKKSKGIKQLISHSFRKISRSCCRCCTKVKAPQIIEPQGDAEERQQLSVKEAPNITDGLEQYQDNQDNQDILNSKYDIQGESQIQPSQEISANNGDERKGPSRKKSSTNTNYKNKLLAGGTEQGKSKKKTELYGISLCICGPRNGIRRCVQRIVESKVFEYFILLMIIFSTILLTLENPLDDPNGTKMNVLTNIDFCVTIIFCAELVLKVILYGFMANGNKSYMRSGWNIIDFLIVIFSIISLIFSGVDFKFIKVFRMLRVLRPLRVISRNEGLRIAVTSLINSIPGIVNVLVISLLFFTLFGIFGVNYFKGTFYHCQPSEVEFPEDFVVITMQDCVMMGGEWVNKLATFDNVVQAIITLFKMSTTEGWIGIMWSGVDNNGIGLEPKENQSIEWIIFFIFFIVSGSLFIMNLFVGVVIQQFDQEKEKLGMNHLLTNNQKEWIQIQILCYKSKPLKKRIQTKSRIRQMCICIVNNPWFDAIIMIFIIMNTLVLALKWYGEPKELPSQLERINYAFAAIFTVEAIIKITAECKLYFKTGWNIFDFIIVVGTLIGIVISNTTDIEVGSQTTIIRAFRIGRIFRLVKKAKSLKMIFQSFVVTIPSLANVGGLLFLFLYLYSILGVFLFAPVKLQDSLNEHANFQSFGTALLTLVRISTGEAWNELMNECGRMQSVTWECMIDPKYDDYRDNNFVTVGCGDPVFSVIFFTTFLLIVSFIFLNLFIAIILQGFSDINEKEDMKISEEEVEQFQTIWAQYDADGSGYINVDDIKPLINAMCKDASTLIPNSSEIANSDKEILKFIANMAIPSYKNFTLFHYQDILNVLTKLKFEKLKGESDEAFEIDMLEEQGEDNNIMLFQKMKKQQMKHLVKAQKTVDKIGDTVFDSGHIMYVPMLTPYVRRFLDRIRKKKLLEQRKDEFLEQHGAQRRYEDAPPRNQDDDPPAPNVTVPSKLVPDNEEENPDDKRDEDATEIDAMKPQDSENSEKYKDLDEFQLVEVQEPNCEPNPGLHDSQASIAKSIVDPVRVEDLQNPSRKGSASGVHSQNSSMKDRVDTVMDSGAVPVPRIEEMKEMSSHNLLEESVLSTRPKARVILPPIERKIQVDQKQKFPGNSKIIPNSALHRHVPQTIIKEEDKNNENDIMQQIAKESDKLFYQASAVNDMSPQFQDGGNDDNFLNANEINDEQLESFIDEVPSIISDE